MKHSLLIALTALAALLAAASCKPAVSGPEKAAKEAIAAIQKGDYDAYAATFDMSESDQKILAGMIEEKAQSQIDKKGGIKDYKILESSIDDDKATVRVQLNYKDGSEDTQTLNFVKKEDGSWKQKLVK